MVSSVFGAIADRLTTGDTWERMLWGTGVVFGGLIVAQSLGASWAFPVALLILAGVLIVNEGT